MPTELSPFAGVGGGIGGGGGGLGYAARLLSIRSPPSRPAAAAAALGPLPPFGSPYRAGQKPAAGLATRGGGAEGGDSLATTGGGGQSLGGLRGLFGRFAADPNGSHRLAAGVEVEDALMQHPEGDEDGEPPMVPPVGRMSGGGLSRPTGQHPQQLPGHLEGIHLLDDVSLERVMAWQREAEREGGLMFSREEAEDQGPRAESGPPAKGGQRRRLGGESGSQRRSVVGDSGFLDRWLCCVSRGAHGGAHGGAHARP